MRRGNTVIVMSGGVGGGRWQKQVEVGKQADKTAEQRRAWQQRHLRGSPESQ
jgi:hypothetical protein